MSLKDVSSKLGSVIVKVVIRKIHLYSSSFLETLFLVIGGTPFQRTFVPTVILVPFTANVGLPNTLLLPKKSSGSSGKSPLWPVLLPGVQSGVLLHLLPG